MTQTSLMAKIRDAFGTKLQALLDDDVVIYWENMPTGDLLSGQGYAKLSLQPAAQQPPLHLTPHNILAGQLGLTIGMPAGSGTGHLDTLTDRLRTALAMQSVGIIEMAHMRAEPPYMQNGFHCLDCQFDFIAWEGSPHDV